MIHMLSDFFATVPNIYTFLDFFVLADGRRFARVWDASTFPSLAIYVDGIKREEALVEYEPRARTNPQMISFFGEAIVGGTPYHAYSVLYYLALLQSEELRYEYYYTPLEPIFDLFPQIDKHPRDIIGSLPLAVLGYESDGTPIENPEDLLTSIFLYPRYVVSGDKREGQVT